MGKFCKFLEESIPSKVVVRLQHDDGRLSQATYPIQLDKDQSDIKDKIKEIADRHLMTSQRFFDIAAGHLQSQGHSRAQKIYRIEVV